MGGHARPGGGAEGGGEGMGQLINTSTINHDLNTLSLCIHINVQDLF